MAEPYDSATVVLNDLADGFKQQYMEGILDTYLRTGSRTNKWFMPTKRRLTGTSIEVTVEDQLMDVARVSTGINDAFPSPNRYNLDTYSVRINETSSSNDIRAIQASVSVLYSDLERAKNNPHEKAALVSRLEMQAIEDVKEKMAIHRWAPSTGLLGSVNGTPVQSDTYDISQGTATPTTGGVRFKVDGGSIAAFRPGVRLDVYTGTTQDHTSVTVVDAHYHDESITVKRNSDNLSTIADNDDLYFSGGYGKGLISIREWFNLNSSNDASTLFTIDRSAVGFKWMVPTILRASSTAATFNLKWLDDMARTAGFVHTIDGDKTGFAMKCSPGVYQQFYDLIDEKSIVQTPSSADQKFMGVYGFDGLIYRHPFLGRVYIEPDEICPPGKMFFIKPGDWETIWGYNQNFTWIPSGDGMGIFYRVPSEENDNQLSKTYRADGLMTLCDICTRPRMQMAIFNITDNPS